MLVNALHTPEASPRQHSDLRRRCAGFVHRWSRNGARLLGLRRRSQSDTDYCHCGKCGDPWNDSTSCIANVEHGSITPVSAGSPDHIVSLAGPGLKGPADSSTPARVRATVRSAISAASFRSCVTNTIANPSLPETRAAPFAFPVAVRYRDLKTVHRATPGPVDVRAPWRMPLAAARHLTTGADSDWPGHQCGRASMSRQSSGSDRGGRATESRTSQRTPSSAPRSCAARARDPETQSRCPACAAAREASCPWSRAVPNPHVAGIRHVEPRTMRSSVVLPTPLAPTRATASPALMRSVRSWNSSRPCVLWIRSRRKASFMDAPAMSRTRSRARTDKGRPRSAPAQARRPALPARSQST